MQGDVSQQAALYLKLVVNRNWAIDETTKDNAKPFSVQNKENLGTANA